MCALPNIFIFYLAEQQKERKKEMARRLLEINARKREERLAEDEEQLNQLLALQVQTLLLSFIIFLDKNMVIILNN